MVGPIPVGVNRFQFQADPPQAKSIPPPHILGAKNRDMIPWIDITTSP
jgi:hypothetical protein